MKKDFPEAGRVGQYRRLRLAHIPHDGNPERRADVLRFPLPIGQRIGDPHGSDLAAGAARGSEDLPIQIRRRPCGGLHLFGAFADFFVDRVIEEDQGRETLDHTHQVVVLVNVTLQKELIEPPRRTLSESEVVRVEEIGHGEEGRLLIQNTAINCLRQLNKLPRIQDLPFSGLSKFLAGTGKWTGRWCIHFVNETRAVNRSPRRRRWRRRKPKYDSGTELRKR